LFSVAHVRYFWGETAGIMLDWREHITSDPKIMLGKPCFKGTRVPVYLILQKIAHGERIEDLLEGYPSLTLDSIKAAQFYAVDAVNNDIVYPAVP
jgi:uncharacterized protein (DUF433 family)